MSVERKGPRLERHITAGPAALAALEALLGLKGWSLDGACWTAEGGGRLRLSLRSGPHGLVLYVRPDMTLEAEGPAGAKVEKLLAAFSARLKGRTPAGLAALLEEDPLSFSEKVPVDGPGDRVKVPCIGQPMPLLEAGWRNFYADQDFEVLLGVPSCSSSKKTLNIEYADLECYYARPRRSFTKWTFMDWPEESPSGGGEGEAEPKGERRGGGSIVTELEERDMIMGTGERADALVDEVKKRAKPGDFLLFTHLCTPIIMGEDMQGLAKRCEKEIGGSAVRWSQKDRDDNDNFGDYFRSLLASPGFYDGAGDPLSVNLFHFPKPVRDTLVKPFLEKLGLKVNISVFPDVSFPCLRDLPKARWQVFCERSSYPTKVREMLEGSPRPVVPVAAPYGVEGTRRCLEGIAAACGKQAEFAAAWAETAGETLAAWERGRAEAAGQRLAFVVSEATLPRLVGLRYGHGAPLAPMVLEMGFGVDLIYYDRHGQPPALPPALKDAGVTCFKTPWELSRALGESRAAAVYSDVFFDWRISRAGKARFSGKDFEMGLAGARRTFEHLLSLCRLPFYRRYGAHLSAGRGRPRVL